IMNAEPRVWVFCGTTNPFPSAVFLDRDAANMWITKHKLTGVLTAYPTNISVYDWAIQNNYFRPSRDYQTSPKFIANFSSAYLEHYHYEEGPNIEERPVPEKPTKSNNGPEKGDAEN